MPKGILLAARWMAIGLVLGAVPAQAGDVGVDAPRLSIVDKGANKRTIGWAAKHTSIQKGPDGAANDLDGRLDLYYVDTPANRGTLPLPSPWASNAKGKARFVNKQAPAGSTIVRVGSVKNLQRAVVAAKELGGIDITSPPGAGGILTIFTLRNAADGDTRRMCSLFSVAVGSKITHQPVRGGVKLVAKNGRAVDCPVSCSDGIKNGQESDIDCGGSCADCLVGDDCSNHSDCASGYCSDAICQNSVASCTDGVWNGDEADVDCGGSCGDCDDGDDCASDSDCASGVCSGNVCQVPTCSDAVSNQGEAGVDCGGPCAACPSCSDSLLNQGESGIDCGGPCAPCATCTDGIRNQGEDAVDCHFAPAGACRLCDGEFGCNTGDSCRSGICIPGFPRQCGYATCSDGSQNQSEAGVDCGGPCTACPPSCHDGIQNQGEVAIDCGSPCPVCTCTDGIRNQSEVGVDCGGPCTACPSCSDGISNQGEAGVDCGGPCAACPTCSDGIQNQGEVAVDCGGPCAVCTCTDGIRNQGEAGVDCGGPCAACPATCSDGIQNQDETTIDCGGSCPPCSCIDGIRNQGEGGVDCDGPCGLCPGAYCFVSNSAACSSGTCINEFFGAGSCAAPTCYDGRQNQGEPSADCGGPCAVCSCTDGVRNQGEDGVDCGGPCVACETCSDGIQNQTETDVDCGGPCSACPTCSDGIQNQGESDVDCSAVYNNPCKVCVGGGCQAFGADQCQSGFCYPTSFFENRGICAVPTCYDSWRNQGETLIDCGGPCAACPTCSDGIKNQGEGDVDCGGGVCEICGPGRSCNSNGDCSSGICSGNVCTEPSCFDGIKNGSEGGIDCGGNCARCPLGSACTTDYDCFGSCDGGICKCPPQVFDFEIISPYAPLFQTSNWPGGSGTSVATFYGSPNPACRVNVSYPSGDIALTGTLGDRWRLDSYTGFSSCVASGGEDGDGCVTPSCANSLAIPYCEAGRPSCTFSFDNWAEAHFRVSCSP